MLPSFPSETVIAVVGLGYVGLPLLDALSHHLETLQLYDKDTACNPPLIGFDINSDRVSQLLNSCDITNQVVDFSDISSFTTFTSNPNDLSRANVFIVTVPTPVTRSNTPDLTCLINATTTVATAVLESLESFGTIPSVSPVIIFESTVYPGVTIDVCVPIIERITGLKLNSGFFVGYSPERVNPSDKQHTLVNIVKVTSGSSTDSAAWIDKFYSSFITAGTYTARSIVVAEAAKVIENTQRDLNIALINEFSHIFKRLEINTFDVLSAASTKWNFLNFRPGLVGGHCIGVDPYYLAHCASLVDYNPELILAGRRINDSMYQHVGEEIIRHIVRTRSLPQAPSVLLLGATFKEDCSDLRNSQALRLASYLHNFDLDVHIYDPVALSDELVTLLPFASIHQSLESLASLNFSAVAVLVSHSEFLEFNLDDWHSLLNSSFVYDLKGIVPSVFSPSNP